jgi:hypothetical protein
VVIKAMLGSGQVFEKAPTLLMQHEIGIPCPRVPTHNVNHTNSSTVLAGLYKAK